MKTISLDVSVSNANYEILKDAYANAELERLVARFLLDTADLSNPKQQDKLLHESRKIMNKLKNLK